MLSNGSNVTLLLLPVGLGAAAAPHASIASLAVVFPESGHLLVKDQREQEKI